ncbi:hypothetical protein DPMN_169975 [Dreissena polymorpha]|uniref:Uncharacterized protein n=1 Tax=Dreissena polymorpha TaxID=45954 RepID=A0A9D4DWH9_DREPO|nr:hypothetical protein DPMN_169975 [Dreissena polymorpha]
MQTRPTIINFVKEGSAPIINRSKNSGILASVNDWILMVDLKRQLRFPPDVTKTIIRPDV